MTKMKLVGICVKWGLAGAVVGVALNYYLYRVWLPIVPFVYQAF
jgi:hypothetical protein